LREVAELVTDQRDGKTPIPAELQAALEQLPTPRCADSSRFYFINGTGSVRTAISVVERCLRAVFKKSAVVDAHAHRFRHTLVTELLGAGASFEEVADILRNSPAIVRKHYAKWSQARQDRITRLMQSIHAGTKRARTLKIVASN
jgi:integrase